MSRFQLDLVHRPLCLFLCPQLAGRPVPDVCRHLGLTAGAALVSSEASCAIKTAQATRKTKSRSGNQSRLEDWTSDKFSTGPMQPQQQQQSRHNLSSSMPSRERVLGGEANAERGVTRSPGVNAEGISTFPARSETGDDLRATVADKSVGASSRDTAATVGAGAGVNESGVEDAPGVKRSRIQGRTKPVRLLPRHRIFYSSTFVR